jgi:hypothetical protein
MTCMIVICRNEKYYGCGPCERSSLKKINKPVQFMVWYDPCLCRPEKKISCEDMVQILRIITSFPNMFYNLKANTEIMKKNILQVWWLSFLKAYFVNLNNRMSATMVACIAVEAISILEKLHCKGYRIYIYFCFFRCSFFPNQPDFSMILLGLCMEMLNLRTFC